MVLKFSACDEDEAQLESQYRELLAKKLTPSSSPAPTPAVSVADNDDLEWTNHCDFDADLDRDRGLEGGLPASGPSSQRCSAPTRPSSG